MDECIDSLGDAKRFTTLDCYPGYSQVELAPEDPDKTAFTFHHGLYRFKHIPFGLKNAPGTFEREIDIILSSIRWQQALVYLEDIIVFSATVQEHLQHLATVLEFLDNAGMTMKLEKCSSYVRPSNNSATSYDRESLAWETKTGTRCRSCAHHATCHRPQVLSRLVQRLQTICPKFARVAAPLKTILWKD